MTYEMETGWCSRNKGGGLFELKNARNMISKCRPACHILIYLNFNKVS